MDLNSPDISYVLFSDGDLDGTYFHMSLTNNYQVNEIKTYLNGNYGSAVLAIPKNNIDQRTIKEDVMSPILKMGCKRAVVKYPGKTHPSLLFPNGSEKPLNPIPYNTDGSRLTYIVEHLTFAFDEMRTYVFIEKKEELHNNMIVECHDGTKWVERQIIDRDTEYEQLYKLMMKYRKVRVPCDTVICIE
jgi:hypothetical protein